MTKDRRERIERGVAMVQADLDRHYSLRSAMDHLRYLVRTPGTRRRPGQFTWPDVAEIERRFLSPRQKFNALNYALTDHEGRVVAGSRTSAGAHRASRMARHLGAGVNRATSIGAYDPRHPTAGWFIVDVQEGTVQCVTEDAPDNPPRFLKVYANDADQAHVWGREQRQRRNRAGTAAITKRQVVAAMRRAGIVGEVRGSGVAWEVELPDEKAMNAFWKKVARVGGYRTGSGAWVLRPGYVPMGEYGDPGSRWHY